MTFLFIVKPLYRWNRFTQKSPKLSFDQRVWVYRSTILLRLYFFHTSILLHDSLGAHQTPHQMHHHSDITSSGTNVFPAQWVNENTAWHTKSETEEVRRREREVRLGDKKIHCSQPPKTIQKVFLICLNLFVQISKRTTMCQTWRSRGNWKTIFLS